MVIRFLLLFFTKFIFIAYPVLGESNSENTEKAFSSDLISFIESQAQPMDQAGQISIPSIDLPPEIDGKLEEAWKQAAVWKLPWEIERAENRPAPDETYVLAMTSDAGLHFAFISKDSQPYQIRSTLTDRDSWSFGNNDAVGFYFDPYGDGRNAYQIAVNAAGVQADASRMDRGAQGTEDDSSFDFQWHAETTRFDGGYVAEMTVPLRHLQLPDTNNEQLEVGLLPIRLQPRDFRRKLSPVEWDFDRSCFLCQIPKVQIENPEETSAPIQYIPYTSGFAEGDGAGTNLADHPADVTGSIGIDLKYQTTNSVIDATVFPDFSQVETDAFEMTSNVRFAPRFAEQRPFFMERTDLFRFPISQTLYTRSIVDPTAGARWTGKAGAHNWAMISMHDQTGWFLDPGPQSSRSFVDDDVSSWNNLFRYRYDTDDGMMGLFYSDRVTEDGYNRLISYDAQIGVGSNHTFVFQPLASWNRYPDHFGEQYNVSTDRTFDYGYLLRLQRSGRNWDYRAETRRYGKDLITGTGILQQTDVQTAAFQPGYNFWMDNSFFERIRVWFHSSGTWHLDGGNLSSVLSDPELISGYYRPGISFYGANQFTVQFSYTNSHERVEGTINDSFIEQDFNLNSFWGRFSMDITPDYQLSLNGSYGSAVDFRLIEEMNEYDVSLSNSLYLFNRSLQLSHNVSYMRLFDDEDITQEAMTQRLTTEYQVTRRFAIRNILQFQDFQFEDPRYDELEALVPDQIQTVQNQTLFRYRINHATAIYLGGFAEIGEEAPRVIDDPVQEQSQWQIFAKISYLL